MVSLPNFIIEIPIIYYCLHSKNIAYHITEVLAFYADKLTVTAIRKI